jgi:hypothetical protein
VFDGGRLTSSETTLLRPHGDGIAEARYWRADELDDLAPARLVTLLRLALTARGGSWAAVRERGTTASVTGMLL